MVFREGPEKDVEELQPLRERSKIFREGLKRWAEDPIIRELDKVSRESAELFHGCASAGDEIFEEYVRSMETRFHER
jgi:hypothetical protein